MPGLLDAITGSNDPSTADPATGLLESQRHQLAFNALGQTGALLLAAGQPMMPGQNANILAQIGNVPGSVQQQASQMGQMNAQNQRTIAEQRKNAQQADLAKMMQTPEFQQEFEKMPPAQKAVIKAAAVSGDTASVLKALQEAQVATKPQFTADGSVYNPQTGDVMNPLTGVRYNINAMQGQAAGGTPSGASGDLHGDDYLKTLPPSMAGTVKAIAEGRQAMPTGMIMKTGYGQALMQNLNQYEPGFEGTNYPARMATAKAFAAGKEAQSIRALNQATQHMGVLHQAGTELNNTDYPLLNTGLNALATAGGSAKASNFIAAAHPVAEEVSKIFKGANLSDSEVRQWEKSLSPNMSPEQMQGSLETINHLMDGALDALNTQYQKTMGKPLNAMTPQSKATLDYIKANPIGQKKAEAAPPAQGSTAAPAPGQPNQPPGFDPNYDYRQKPDGTWQRKLKQ